MSNNSVFSGIKNPNPLNLKLPNINSEEFDKVINMPKIIQNNHLKKQVFFQLQRRILIQQYEKVENFLKIEK